MTTQSNEPSGLSRRAILRGTAAAGIGAAALGAGTPASADPRAVDEDTRVPRRRGDTMIGVPFEKRANPRFALIGLGNRGASMLPLFLAVPGAKVTALCDVDPARVAEAAKVVTDAGQPEPARFSGSEHAFEQLLAREDIDLVYIATPWEWHHPMGIAAMKAGKHVGLETPFATTIKELWDLVDTSEQTRRHCIQLENCNYGRNELRALRVVHAGKFGEVLQGSGAYVHDLRELLFSKTYYAGQWRRAWHTKVNGDLYPTHGLGPVAAYMDINRGDRLVSITSTSTPARGLAEYRAAHMPPGDPTFGETYVKGDTTTSLIRTEKGRVIHLVHNVSSPHPYSRLNHIIGTKGTFEDYTPRVYLEPEHTDHKWRNWDDYKSFDHWLWTDVGPGPGGHGGMDYIMLWRLNQCMQLGLPPDIDVYDSAAWSAPFPLSAKSIGRKASTVDIPDFTRGKWTVPHPGTDSPKPS
ncbi:putative dehydrogenase [Herbihabitans rhizosphaerae]|uniref:Glycosyl hydrolase family 109 protein n=1 Tax=Herbihabitans rhizosphaerae TaxID=1872711 RepID=A0A4Q7KCT4_9PSEU|nr:Gfo/Idh/MocA family oxidoreductase [Herbihabitans rhizosphaerae]RZS30496.1 putative dehydrogenase [Herbihabitans rhizosphaerae]